MSEFCLFHEGKWVANGTIDENREKDTNIGFIIIHTKCFNPSEFACVKLSQVQLGFEKLPIPISVGDDIDLDFACNNNYFLPWKKKGMKIFIEERKFRSITENSQKKRKNRTQGRELNEKEEMVIAIGNVGLQG